MSVENEKEIYSNTAHNTQTKTIRSELVIFFFFFLYRSVEWFWFHCFSSFNNFEAFTRNVRIVRIIVFLLVILK